MPSTLASSLRFALLLVLSVPIASAEIGETFPVVHSDAITLHVVDGKRGQPLMRVRMLLTGGYDQRDLALGLWQQEAQTDDQGRVRLPKSLANLPLLRVSLHKGHLCQKDAKESVFRVEEIRRDGLSAPNHCGTFVVEETPGVFTLFAKARKADSAPSPAAPALSSKPTALAASPTSDSVVTPPLVSPMPNLPSTPESTVVPTSASTLEPTITTTVVTTPVVAVPPRLFSEYSWETSASETILLPQPPSAPRVAFDKPTAASLAKPSVSRSAYPMTSKPLSVPTKPAHDKSEPSQANHVPRKPSASKPLSTPTAHSATTSAEHSAKAIHPHRLAAVAHAKRKAEPLLCPASATPAVQPLIAKPAVK